jgi:hypothetical protein
MLVIRDYVHLSPDQVSFYDETLKKQIEGSYRYNGKAIHVASVKYGARSAPTAYFGTSVDHFAIASYARQLLSELARDAEKQKALSELARDAEKGTANSQSYKKAA